MTDAPVIGAVHPPDLHVMSVNIRRRTPPIGLRRDRWSERAPRLRHLLRSEHPSLLGVQEALGDQARFVREALGASYRSIGRGRNAAGGGEGCPLYYDSDRLELLDSEQTALSHRPATAGSISWGNLFPRIVVSATLRDRETSATFLALNTHFDHLSRRARIRSARAIRRTVTQQSLPAVVMGDLNAGERSATLSELFADAELVDSWDVAAVRTTPKWGTFPNYRPPRENGRRIDWIVVTPTVRVCAVAVNSRQIDGGWASDHLPVHAVLRLGSER